MPAMKNTKSDREEYNRAIREEKLLTARWYERMSGQKPWESGGKIRCVNLFADIEKRIHRLESEETADWFEGLPEA